MQHFVFQIRVKMSKCYTYQDFYSTTLLLSGMQYSDILFLLALLQMLKTWPLTTVRRWAASPNSFTLDFGDYSESYYSVQTTEGETISQLIAGYIDIIIKKVNSIIYWYYNSSSLLYNLHSSSEKSPPV